MDQQFISQLLEFAANHGLMVMAWVLVFVVTIFTFFKSATSKIKVVDNTEATFLINKENAVIVDLRSDKEFDAGHIVGSLHVVPEDIKTANLGALSKHVAQPVILVDTANLTNESLGKALVKEGFAQVYTLKEGITGWRSANLPLVKH